MITVKEKAAELIETFYYPTLRWAFIHAKECAVKAVDEIIKSRKEDKGFNDILSFRSNEYYNPNPMYLTYWEQVKEEIKNFTPKYPD